VSGACTHGLRVALVLSLSYPKVCLLHVCGSNIPYLGSDALHVARCGAEGH
jgi:hypothetical protein